MVWQAQSVEEQRREFVRIAEQDTIPFRELCRRFGISPPDRLQMAQSQRRRGPRLGA